MQADGREGGSVSLNLWGTKELWKVIIVGRNEGVWQVEWVHEDVQKSACVLGG